MLAKMPEPAILTVAQYIAGREDLPEGGRWTELIAGRVVTLAPPSIEHGTAVLNLSKALAEFTRRDQSGYACFDLGLVLSRLPAVVRFPAVSFFAGGPMFSESDKTITETRPALVADVASTNDRRRGMEERVTSWLDWGVPLVWVLDTAGKQVHAFEKGCQGQRLAEHQTLLGGSVLSGFNVNVGDLFKEPAWAR
ncbi:MAG: Uma2 family endonuclease [Planctomycetaceae bacterium]